MAMQGGEGFEWDVANEAHATRHGFTVAQIEAALNDPFGVDLTATASDQPNFGWVGMTDTGAILAIIYTFRGRRVRPFSARKASRAERRLWMER
jgi:uncharacterized DUF497 family protein